MPVVRVMPASVALGERRTYKSLSIWPMIAVSGAGAEPPGYRPADAAHAAGTFSVVETGHMSRIVARNDGPDPVFVLGGEMLTGGAQDRVIASSLLLPAGCRIEIEVLCCEAGRWCAQGRPLTPSGQMEFGAMRTLRIAGMGGGSSGPGARGALQVEVWEGIAARSRAATCSRGASLSVLHEAYDAELDRYRKALRPTCDALGAVYFRDGSLAGIDLFESPAIFAGFADRLASGYALDVLASQDAVGTGATRRGPLLRLPRIAASRSVAHDRGVATAEAAIVTEMLARIRQQAASACPAPGLGETLHFDDGDLCGGALHLAGSCVHLWGSMRPTSGSA